MCLAAQTPTTPTTAAQAMAMVQAGLGWLATHRRGVAAHRPAG